MSASVLAETDEVALPPASEQLRRIAVRSGKSSEGSRIIAEETAIALSYGGSTHAVMMATPQDFEDFAVGFSLTERIVEDASEIETIEIIPTPDGVEVQMWLAKPRAEAHVTRHRHLAGPTGCGLCGIDSLAEATRRPPEVGEGIRLDAKAIGEAIASLVPHQTLNRQTGAVHAAGFWRPSQGLVCLREDVGRHNALDKLIGALARSGENGRDGALLLTSRVSVEMVQKAAVLGSSILVAVSAPTALALRTANAAGITLVAIARSDGFEVFTRPERILPAP
jgi:FdhD protein